MMRDLAATRSHLAILAVVVPGMLGLWAGMGALAPPMHRSMQIGVESTPGTLPGNAGVTVDAPGTPTEALRKFVATVNNAVHGIAKYYNPGVFEIVARNRKMRLRSIPTDVFGYAAVADCRKIGMVVLASVGSLGPERYQVVDCVQDRDQEAHKREGLIIEVDHATAVRAGLVGNDCTGPDGSTQHGCGKAVIYGYSR